MIKKRERETRKKRRRKGSRWGLSFGMETNVADDDGQTVKETKTKNKRRKQ